MPELGRCKTEPMELPREGRSVVKREGSSAVSRDQMESLHKGRSVVKREKMESLHEASSVLKRKAESLEDEGRSEPPGSDCDIEAEKVFRETMEAMGDQEAQRRQAMNEQQKVIFHNMKDALKKKKLQLEEMGVLRKRGNQQRSGLVNRAQHVLLAAARADFDFLRKFVDSEASLQNLNDQQDAYMLSKSVPKSKGAGKRMMPQPPPFAPPGKRPPLPFIPPAKALIRIPPAKGKSKGQQSDPRLSGGPAWD